MRIIFFVICAQLLSSCASSTKGNYSPTRSIEEKYLEGNKVVLVSNPLCSFCQRAFQDFSPSTRKFLSSNGVIVTPISKAHAAVEVAAVEEWNRENPQFIHEMIPLKAKLTGLSTRSTPQFYFFKEGKLIGKVVGWPKDGSNEKAVQGYISKLSNSR